MTVLLTQAPARAPGQTPVQAGEARRVEGQVDRGTREGPRPVANQWVVLHRVGPDRAGPLDSTRTSASGSFAMSYHTSGDSTALYFLSTSYGGVAYFSSPLRAALVKGDDATLTVFDTTSGSVNIKVGGRHLIVGAPQANGRRPIGEVFDLQNDSTVTLVARNGSTPTWTTHIPTDAVAFQINTNGEISPQAVTHTGSTVGLLVPLSPGVRQFAFTYELPASAFPLHLPVERPIGVFEVLMEEPTAHVQGSTLREVAPVATDGRTFRRFLGQDAPVNSVVEIEVPHIVGAERERLYVGVGVVFFLAMVVALVVAARRASFRVVGTGGTSGVAQANGRRREPRSQSLLRTIADLDAEFEQNPAPDDEARARYEARRTELKAELAGALTDERR